MTNQPTDCHAVVVHMRYLVHDPEPPVTRFSDDGEEVQSRGRYDSIRMRVGDARRLDPAATLDREGFELRSHATAVEDCYDDALVRAFYYPEMERLVRDATGADRVLVFDHNARAQGTARHRHANSRDPVHLVHNDFTDRSGPLRLRRLVSDSEADELLRGRFVMVNVWRPIRGPVESAPLAVCDASSIAPADLVAADMVYRERTGSEYRSVHNDAHHWYYYPHQSASDALLIKVCDSARDGRARCSLHTAFDAGRLVAQARFAELADGLRRFGLILLRGDRLAPAQLLDLARGIGEPRPALRPEFTHPGLPALTRLGNTDPHGPHPTYLNTQGVEWHIDNTGGDPGPGFTFLHAIETPARGGDTMFASTAHGYETLPDRLRRRIERLEVAHSFKAHNDKLAGVADTNVSVQDPGAHATSRDRLVRIHPSTGRRHLFLSQQMIVEVVGMDLDAGMRLIREVLAHATRDESVYRHRWRPGDLVVFCNRSCMHSATEYDYAGERRLLLQVIVNERATPS